MGTRSLTVVNDERGREIMALYRQYDGYPTGHGEELVEFLRPFTVVNGLSGDKSKVANGAECLAAQIVAHFKTEPGGFYLYPAKTRDVGEEWIYTVYTPKRTKKDDGDRIRGLVYLKVQGGDVTYFGMPGTKQGNMPVLFDGPVDAFDAKSIEDAYAKLADAIPNDFLNDQAAKGNGGEVQS